MSKVLKVVGAIAAGVALIATGVGAFAVAGSATAATATSVATWAGLAAGVAAVGAQLLYKPPPARGSITQTIIAADPPQPYVMGEGLVGGVERYKRSFGATLNKVPNPYRFIVDVFTGGGPVESITPYIDQAAVSSWYSGFLYTDTQLGACPESTALSPQWAGAPGWDAASKLSGQAAIGWSALFDKDGKRFASGFPQRGAYGKWVKAYDPRLDSTRAGGSGTQRVNNEATWTWTENVALHAGTYALGRHQNGKRTIGVGLPADAINWANVAAWANVCDANGWTIFGAVYEPGGAEVRWANLREIAAAGGAQPIMGAAGLSFHYSAPRVSLATVTEADFAFADQSVTSMTTWRELLNTVVPKFRSPDHNWELVPGGAVTDAGYVALDGEEKLAEWPFNLVKNKDQASELAAYKLVDSRELQPIVLRLGAHMRGYAPGDCLTLDLPCLALDTDAVILKRQFDPAALTVTFTLIGETSAKHAFALGRTGSAPATPAIGQTSEERDQLRDATGQPIGWTQSVIRNAASKNPRDTSDVPRAMLIGRDGGASAEVDIARHDWDYPGAQADVTREGAVITGLTFSQFYYVYFDDESLEDTSPTYAVTTDPAESLNSTAHPYRHSLGLVLTPADGNPPEEGGSNAGYGYVYSDYY